MAERMSKAEFIALIGVMFATVAFSIDAMLPALTDIGVELSPADPNRAQLILTSFVLGMGIGTFFMGPLSDALGRKPVILGGTLLYIVASLVALRGTTLDVVLAARVVQGIGAAAPRIVSAAIVRDLHAGREMARIISIAMMIFMIFPALAPAMGAGIIAFSGWRGVFWAFVAFAILMVGWMQLRLPESLPPERRRPFRMALLRDALSEMLRHPSVRLSTIVQTLCMGMLFTMLTMVQPIYETIFDRADSFPFWFGAVALVSGSASLLNAVVVVRLGMRRLVTWALGGQTILSGIMVLLANATLPDGPAFAIFLVWQTSLFFMAGITLGNLNAIAMEPLGHVAGLAASVIGAMATVGAVVIAVPIGLLFDGTLLPLAAGLLTLSAISYLLMLHMGRIEERQVA